jgi:hypothetical protein
VEQTTGSVHVEIYARADTTFVASATATGTINMQKDGAQTTATVEADTATIEATPEAGTVQAAMATAAATTAVVAAADTIVAAAATTRKKSLTAGATPAEDDQDAKGGPINPGMQVGQGAGPAATTALTVGTATASLCPGEEELHRTKKRTPFLAGNRHPLQMRLARSLSILKRPHNILSNNAHHWI